MFLKNKKNIVIVTVILIAIIGLIYAGCSKSTDMQTTPEADKIMSIKSAHNLNYDYQNIVYNENFVYDYRKFYSVEHDNLNYFLHLIEESIKNTEFKNENCYRAFENKLRTTENLIIIRNFMGAKKKIREDLIKYVDKAIINQSQKKNIKTFLEITHLMLKKFGRNEIKIMPLPINILAINTSIAPAKIMEQNEIYYIEFSIDYKIINRTPGQLIFDGVAVGKGFQLDCIWPPSNCLVFVYVRKTELNIDTVQTLKSSTLENNKTLYEILINKPTFIEETSNTLYFKAIKNGANFNEDINGLQRIGIRKNWVLKQN
jgi:hypothetical protein